MIVKLSTVIFFPVTLTLFTVLNTSIFFAQASETPLMVKALLLPSVMVTDCSGHGWTIGWAVAWNCKARSYLNQMPPGAANWVIGSIGQKQKRARPFDEEPLLPEGIYDAHGLPVAPASLYFSCSSKEKQVIAFDITMIEE